MLQKLKDSFFQILFTLLALYLTFLLLRYPARSLNYAYTGLLLWLRKMIPTLLPFKAEKINGADIVTEGKQIGAFFFRQFSRLTQFADDPCTHWKADDSIVSGLIGIGKLGGYMVFFNLLNILFLPFSSLSDGFLALCNCLLEITSGISRVGKEAL